MAANTQEQPRRENKAQRQQQIDVIGKNILLELGKPEDFHRIQVRSLWDDHYRANVFVGSDYMSATIAHSFFVRADEEGNVVKSLPTIQRKY